MTHETTCDRCGRSISDDEIKTILIDGEDFEVCTYCRAAEFSHFPEVPGVREGDPDSV